jgi:4a-hydroxytetrahydrobiopterin dehydratase
MADPQRNSLSESELTGATSDLRGWAYDRDRRALYRRIELPDFSCAIGFMVRVAMEAQRIDHHPEWSNVYNRIDIWLTTHSVQGVSEHDLAMARYIDAILELH